MFVTNHFSRLEKPGWKVLLLMLILLVGCSPTLSTPHLLLMTRTPSEITERMPFTPSPEKILPSILTVVTETGTLIDRSPIEVQPTATEGPTFTPAPSELSGYVVYSAFVNREAQLFLVKLNTGLIQQLTTLGSNDTPAWSPDGKQIAFSSTRDGYDDDLYIMDVESQTFHRLTKYKGDEILPDWSPDGKKIAFASDHEGGNNEIYVIDIATKEVTRLTNNASTDIAPRWSTDGTRIAFVSDRAGDGFTSQIYIMNSDGSHVEQLTSERYIDDSPVWCPDDSCIVYQQSSLNSIGKLMVINIKTKITKPLLSKTFNSSPGIYQFKPSRSPVRGYITFQMKGLFYAYDLVNSQLYSLGLQGSIPSLYP